MELMEERLVAYIEDCAKNGNPFTQIKIQAEARDMLKEFELQFYGKDESKCSNFKASQGWFWRFCRRHNMKHLPVFGESALVNKNVVQKFVEEFEEIAKDYSPHQIFNFDEYGLYWRKIPGNKQNCKQSVTLLFGKLA